MKTRLMTVTACVWLSVRAAAAAPEDAQIIPYSGTLELNGTPVTGAVDMDFVVYDGADVVVYSELQTVQVVVGEFSVEIGKPAPIPDAVWRVGELSLEVVVEGTPLTGRQRLAPAPYAWRAVPGREFAIDGEIFWRGYPMSPTENVRSWMTKTEVDAVCGATNSALHVPWQYRGMTGDELCALDYRNRTMCTAVKFVYGTMELSSAHWPSSDRACNQPVDTPWPWGNMQSVPNTLSTEWSHGNTYVVCCQ